MDDHNGTGARELSDDLLGKYDAYDRLGLRALIRSDMRRWKTTLLALTCLGFHATFMYRLSRHLCRHHCGFFGKFFQFWCHLVTGAEISHNAIIGPGLMILHPTAVHIGPHVRIGSNAHFCECSAVVSNGEIGEGEPVIGDYLWAGSGSKVMGPILLGDHVSVGPNSVVLRDVESDRVALGIPARIMPKDFRLGP